MKVRSFSVNKFRGFTDERSFPLSDRFTVVAGVNGRGKTAILDGLALLISRLLSGLELSARNQRSIAASDVFVEARDASLEMEATCASVPIAFGVKLRRYSKTVRTTHVTPIFGSGKKSDHAELWGPLQSRRSAPGRNLLHH